MKKCIIILVALSIAAKTPAQKNDSLEAVRTFVDVCGMYKKTPMHLELRFYSEANYITNEADTLSAQGEFYIQPDRAYIRFGEMEQLVNDSVALLVSDQQQRMILFTDARPVIAQMKSAMGILGSDASYLNISKKYSAVIKQQTVKTSVVALQSRHTLYGTALPKETIDISYTPETKQPQKIVTVKRSLIPLEKADYDVYNQQAEMKQFLLAVEDKQWFLVKEVVSTFEYSSIDYDAALDVPVQLKDRVEKNAEGNYVPVKEYGGYGISKGN